MEHRAGADRRQLIDIADEHELRTDAERRGDRAEQHDVDHRGLVDHEEIGVERILGVLVKAAFLRLVLEQAMDRHRFDAGRLAEALRGAPGRRRERDLARARARDVDDRLHDRGLADAGAAGDHGAAVAQRRLDRAALLIGELDRGQRLERVDRGHDVERERARVTLDDLRELVGARDLGIVILGQRAARAAIAEDLADDQPEASSPASRGGS